MSTTIKTIQILGLLAALGVMPSVADAGRVARHTRIAHAKELLGGKYRKSIVRYAESLDDVSDFVEAMTKKFLPKKFVAKSKTLATAIIRESEKNGFDPIFVMAVIQNESSFSPTKVGTVGELGLMQIRPSTAAWFTGLKKSKRLKYKGKETLLDPVENVRIGTAYLAYLRDRFASHSRLYISAYNMGVSRVRSLVGDDHMPKDYVQAVMKRYVAMYHAFSEDDRSTSEQISVAYAKLQDMTRKVASSAVAANSPL